MTALEYIVVGLVLFVFALALTAAICGMFIASDPPDELQ